MSSVTNTLISDMDLHQPSPEFAQKERRWDAITTAHNLLAPWDTQLPTPGGKEALAKNGQATLMLKLHDKMQHTSYPTRKWAIH